MIDPVEIPMVLVDQDEGWRPVGILSAEEVEALERAHDDGDARAEARLELLRHGRPDRSRAITAPAPPPPGFWHNCAYACGVAGCHGFGDRAGPFSPPGSRRPDPRRLPP